MEFLVLHAAQVPGIGQTAMVLAYRGEHETHLDAAKAAIAAMNLRTNQVMFNVANPAFVRFTARPDAVEG